MVGHAIECHSQLIKHPYINSGVGFIISKDDQPCLEMNLVIFGCQLFSHSYLEENIAMIYEMNGPFPPSLFDATNGWSIYHAPNPKSELGI